MRDPGSRCYTAGKDTGTFLKKDAIFNWLKSRLRRGPTNASGAPPSAFLRVAYHTPRQVVLLTARHEGAEDVWPVDWHIPLSHEPPLYGVSLTRGGFGSQLVRASAAFVVNFVPASWEETIFSCGRTSARQVDKFAAVGLLKEEATGLDAPRLAAALACLECRVIQTIEVGDHTFFVGETVQVVQRQDAVRLCHLDGSLRTAASQFGDGQQRR